MNKPDLLRTFVGVSELSSFTQAADSLGLPRRVRVFMDWLEALIEREVRRPLAG